MCQTLGARRVVAILHSKTRSSLLARFRFGFDGKNPMSNKNLVFDEVHNMLALPRQIMKHVAAFLKPRVSRQVERKLLEGLRWQRTFSHSVLPPWKISNQEPLRRLRKARQCALQCAVWVFA